VDDHSLRYRRPGSSAHSEPFHPDLGAGQQGLRRGRGPHPQPHTRAEQAGIAKVLRVLSGSLGCCTTSRLNVSRRASATPQPCVVHVVAAAQSPAGDGRATYATPLAAVGEVCPWLLPARFAKTHLMSGLHPERMRVVRSERRTSLTVNVGCWHALPMGIHATLMLAPGCSRPKSEPTTSPDAVTDGGGGGRPAARRARYGRVSAGSWSRCPPSRSGHSGWPQPDPVAPPCPGRAAVVVTDGPPVPPGTPVMGHLGGWVTPEAGD
jgi:hypothetical protein